MDMEQQRVLTVEEVATWESLIIIQEPIMELIIQEPIMERIIQEPIMELTIRNATLAMEKDMYIVTIAITLERFNATLAMEKEDLFARIALVMLEFFAGDYFK